MHTLLFSRRVGVLVPALLLLLSGAWGEAAGPKDASQGSDLPASLAAAQQVSRSLQQALSSARPESDITGIESQSKSKYAPRGDGAWLFQAGPHPGQDVLTLKLTTQAAGAFLRLEFPTDASLPAAGPGLAGNGNAVIGEIEIEWQGKRVAAEIFSSKSQSNHGRTASTALDGVKQQGDPGWEAEASGWELGCGQAAQLVLKLESLIPAQSHLSVRIIARSKWNQHVPGIVRASVVGGPDGAQQAARLEAIRKDFSHWERGLASQWQDKLSKWDGGPIAQPSDALLALTQAELLRCCTAERVWEVATRKDGEQFLRRLLADQPWMESFLLGGSEGTGQVDFAQALENLRLLRSRLDRSVWSDPVSKRLATAMALQAGAMNRFRLVERFGLIENTRHGGLLHAGFDQLDVRAMRHAINLGGTPLEYQHSVDDLQFPAGGYLGACWAVPYTDPSTYGFSIQGWGFHDPLRHAYPITKIFRSIGGVCGTLSGYGANAGVSHGVPAFTVGQPMHCAYVVRIGDHWGTGNDVFGPATNSWSAYEGLTFTSTDHLLEPTENSPDYVNASRLVWRARLLRELSAKQVEAWRPAYEQAIAAQPTNYARWLELIKALEAHSQATTPQSWIELGLRAARTFREHHEAGWALAQRCFQAGKAQADTPTQRVQVLLEAHRILSQKAEPKMYGYGLPNFLNWQADWIGEPDAAVGFFSKLLALHYSEKPELNWVFGAVMNWGSDRFARNPATAAKYATVMGGFFESQGDKADKGQMAATIASGIRKASEAGDAASYRAWLGLAKKLLPALTPGDVHLNPQQQAERPKFEPFPGTLLSESGMLQTSSVSYDKPLSYGEILGGGSLGYFDTAHELKPWAKVTLAGDGELSGLVLVSRYELASEQPWHVPLKVEVSTDGKTWTQVALFDTPQPVFRVDLQGKNLRARYVRIERQPGPDAAKPNNGRLHLRNILIYGKKLY